MRELKMMIGGINSSAERNALWRVAGAIYFSPGPWIEDKIELTQRYSNPTMSDAEAAHYLSWRATDLQRLKFNVISRSIVWRDE